MPTKSTVEKSSADAKFVFKGTIQKLNARTMPQVPKDEPTAVVHVDEILQAPPALANTAGKEITVRLAAGAPKAKKGEQVLFHANSWLFGDSVAVESVKQEKPAVAETMLATREPDPVRNHENRELQKRVADAEIVVEGQVSSIHLPQSETHTALSSRPSGRPVSEHDPKWREAVIDITAVHKGKPDRKQVLLRFPSSNDVQWHRAPKFHAGDRGVWLLTSSKTSSPAANLSKSAEAKAGSVEATAVPGATVYTALHPMDFQPASKIERVAPVIRSAIAGNNNL